MKELQKEFSRVEKKHKSKKNKIDNLIFLLGMISYRFNLVEEKYKDFIDQIEEIVEKFDGRAGLDESKFQDTTCQYKTTQRGFVSTPYNLLFEFYSLLISLISYLDNVVDLYLSIKYQDHPNKGRHWDLGNLKRINRFKKGVKFDFSGDQIQTIVNDANKLWLSHLIDLRDSVIHRVSKKQKYTFDINVEFWAKSLGFPEKKEYEMKPFKGFKDDLNKIAKDYTNSALLLSKNFLSYL